MIAAIASTVPYHNLVLFSPIFLFVSCMLYLLLCFQICVGLRKLQRLGKWRVWE
jgi:hypothetical protein